MTVFSILLLQTAASHNAFAPESPEGFEKWQTLLHDKLRESNTKLEAHYS